MTKVDGRTHAAVPTLAERIELHVDGMTCAGCVGHVERALRAVPGVLRVEVNLVTERASVTATSAGTRQRLVVALEAAGYGASPASPSAPEDHARREDSAERQVRESRRALMLSAGLTAPLVFLSFVGEYIPAPLAALSRLAQVLLGTAVVVGPGQPFFRSAWKAFRRRSADMSTLVALGASAAWVYSAVAVVGQRGIGGRAPDLYFEAGASIVTLVLFGKWLEARARRRLSEAVRRLMSLRPARARRVALSPAGRIEEDVDVASIEAGDLFLVRPGERVATDGLVVDGTSTIDEGMLTGESELVVKHPGDAVFGATQNHGGAMLVRAASVGKDTALARIVHAVEEAQGSKAPIARLADVVSSVFVPAVLGIAVLTFVIWLALDPTSSGLALALERFIAVLVIACPCALGLATPAAVAVATGRAAELGILIRGGEALEAASRVDTVLLDKTGTLTEGKPKLCDVIAVAGVEPADLLAFAAAVEQRSEHPLAYAVCLAAKAGGMVLNEVTAFVSEPAAGVEGVVRGRRVRVGTAAWMRSGDVELDQLEESAERIAGAAHTVAYVAIDGRAAGVLGIADRASPEARAVVSALTAAGLTVTMVTGDREKTAQAIAATVGIAQVSAALRPEGKADVVRVHQRAGRKVAMVGDGINDAPALAIADVGIAVGRGTDIAIAAADIVLLHGGISLLPSALALARATLRTVRQNLFWAFFYNAIGIPIAAGALDRFTGWHLSPMLASAAMSLSSVSVLGNSLRLRSFSRVKVGERRAIALTSVEVL